MLKLNADDVTVESFPTQETDTELLPTNDPTPATRCRWCPEPTFTCP
ncbi:hypothetical protein [Longimicrobium sp.]|nr:hypothetical protein [Longimicrobium sp.]HEX6040182.1 hypothetical protein [Longimicrobium sp.]